MILTGPAFIRICKLIWGRDWVSAAAKAFGKNEKTIWKWGNKAPPADVKLALAKRLEDHIAECGAEHAQLMADAIEY